MKIVLAAFMILCLAASATAVFVWSGFYDVAADVPHWRITELVLEEARERSIYEHSKGIIVPPLKDPTLIKIGFSHYHAMCRFCHNAPGYSRTEISRGLYPAPPDFTAKGMSFPSDKEVYWIVANGIKMTGMPSFRATHTEEELWGMILFAKRVPGMRPEEYEVMLKEAGPYEGEIHHN